MTNDNALVEEYATLIEPHIELAKRAYGSRDTVSPQHDASREYTRLLCEFYKKDGSLLDMAARLGVTYAGLNRRVRTADIPASSKRPRKKFPEFTYEAAVADILEAKATSTEKYHKALKHYYDEGLSLAKIAKKMGLSSANPLYYGVSRVVLAESEEVTENSSDL